MIRYCLLVSLAAVLSGSSWCQTQEPWRTETYLKNCQKRMDWSRNRFYQQFQNAPDNGKGFLATMLGHSYYSPDCQLPPDFENARKYYAIAVELAGLSTKLAFVWGR